MGMQRIASYFAIACYYILCIPSACIFAFWFNFGVISLQAGFTIATAVQCLSYALIVLKSDW